MTTDQQPEPSTSPPPSPSAPSSFTIAFSSVLSSRLLPPALFRAALSSCLCPDQMKMSHAAALQHVQVLILLPKIGILGFSKLPEAGNSCISRRFEARRGVPEARPRRQNILARGRTEACGDPKLYNTIVGSPWIRCWVLAAVALGA